MPADLPTPARRSRRRAVPRNRPGRASFAALAALFACLLSAPAAGAAAARYEDASADGGVVFFTTADALVNGDGDARRDVFARSFEAAVGEYVTRLVSTGPIGGSQAFDATFAAASADGSKAFFSTEERLVSADSDTAFDLYMRDLDENTTTLASRADAACTGCGNGNHNVGGASIAAGGDKVFFTTAEKLSELDGDSETDIYMRDLTAPNTTLLVSQGDAACAPGCGNGPLLASLRDLSDDGDTVFFSTSEGLVAGDGDGATDIYVRDLLAETTALVSVSGICPGGLQSQCNPTFGGVSNDGFHAFFETREQLSVADGDEAQDVYDWSGATVSLASTSPAGGNGPHDANYTGSSTDGESVFFKTDEQLITPDDEDTVKDVYERRGGTVTELVSTGPQSGVPSPAEMDPNLGAIGQGAGLAAVFVTAEALVSTDTDAQQDVYMRAGGETSLVSRGAAECEPSCGNGAFNANIAAASADGAHLVFVSNEQLAAADGDAVQDVYERFGGSTTLVSRGPVGGSGAFPTKQVAIAANGSKVFFETSERLTPDDDFLEEDDVYGRSEVGTLLESQGNDPELELGPPAPTLQGTDPASPAESSSPKVLGQAAAGTEVKLYTNASCSGEQALDPNGQPAGGSGEELATSGIAVAVGIGATVTFYATAEAEGIVSPCSNGVTYRQETPPPPPPPPPPGSEGGSGGGGTSGGTSTGQGSGETGGQPKAHSGGIAFVAPETRITFGPSFKTRKREVVFRFIDATGQPGTRFICRLDKGKWRSCGSPMRLRKLQRGKHVFKVKARNAVGTWEAKPEKRRFKVVRGR